MSNRGWPPRRAAPSKTSPLGGQRATRSERTWGQRPPRRATPSKASPLGGQRATRSERTWGQHLRRRTLFKQAGPRNRLCRATGAAAPSGGQRATRSERTWGHRPPRRAAPSKASPLGGQRATRSERTWGQCQDPRNSPIGFRSSTRSHTALTIIKMGMPSSKPHTPHSQPQASMPTNTATGLIRLARLVSHGVSRLPVMA